MYMDRHFFLYYRHLHAPRTPEHSMNPCTHLGPLHTLWILHILWTPAYTMHICTHPCIHHGRCFPSLSSDSAALPGIIKLPLLLILLM